MIVADALRLHRGVVLTALARVREWGHGQAT
jgi:hypothetical protein